MTTDRMAGVGGEKKEDGSVASSPSCPVVPYYQDAAVTLYHGDCRSILPSLRGDVCITDPPYSPETHAGARTRNDDDPGALVNFASIDSDALAQVVSAINVRRWFVATMDWRHIGTFAAEPPSGYRFVRFGVWVKPNGAPQFTGDRPAQGWEGVCVLHRHIEPLRWNGGGKRAVWTIAAEPSPTHPTRKPLDLIEQFVSLFSDAGETIIDPFAGEGTTLLAAKNLGRKAIGIEAEERHCRTIIERLSQNVLDLGGVA